MHGCRNDYRGYQRISLENFGAFCSFFDCQHRPWLSDCVFQAATQIHEQTLTFVPKLFGILLLLLVLGSWMMVNLTEFFNMIMSMMVEL